MFFPGRRSRLGGHRNCAINRSRDDFRKLRKVASAEARVLLPLGDRLGASPTREKSLGWRSHADRQSRYPIFFTSLTTSPFACKRGVCFYRSAIDWVADYTVRGCGSAVDLFLLSRLLLWAVPDQPGWLGMMRTSSSWFFIAIRDHRKLWYV